jgi:hypothetical protein
LLATKTCSSPSTLPWSSTCPSQRWDGIMDGWLMRRTTNRRLDPTASASGACVGCFLPPPLKLTKEICLSFPSAP